MALVIAISSVIATGCVVFGVKKQQKRLAKVPRIMGTIQVEPPSDGPLVVVLGRRRGESEVCQEDLELVDHFARERPGPFVFGVKPGTYLIGAFHDKSADLHYDPDEPVLRLCGGIEVQLDVGETESGIDLVIPADNLIEGGARIDILGLVEARTAREQDVVTFHQLLVYGEVVPLSDACFDPANGRKGLWKSSDFIVDVRPGIYFIEDYVAEKIPVLFVHGVGGSPREFEYLSEHMDRETFQTWFFFYPSGLPLERIAASLVQMVVELRLRHRFSELIVVAHSMGGLVSRSFLLQHAEAAVDLYIPLFVSISSPFGGMASAEKGVGRSPITLPASFTDVATNSEFLANLFYLDPETREEPRPLPEGVGHHMLFGFQRKSASLGESSDKVVSVASQLAPEAQKQAASIFGIDADHTAILRAPETSERLNAILAEAHR
jgi:pimeloyl-ACP methyl ester carboxylesterase